MNVQRKETKYVLVLGRQMKRSKSRKNSQKLDSPKEDFQWSWPKDVVLRCTR
jgi:hypothetical protein